MNSLTPLLVNGLTCEYKSNPLGLDVNHPRFSWRIESNRRDVRQTAYRIQVSRGNPRFEQSAWDTGKIDSDRSVLVEYTGADLLPCTRYFYRVKVWDNHGAESDWSEAAWWETGLLGIEAWKAEWISPKLPVEGEDSLPADLLRKTFTAGKSVKSARIYATALGLYELYLNGKPVGDALFAPGWTSYNNRLQYQTYDVTALVGPGDNAVGAQLGDGWYKGSLGWPKWEKNSGLYGNRRALLFQMHLVYEDGSEQTVMSDDTWKQLTGPVRMSEIYHGETYDARLERDGWSDASYDDTSWNGVERLDHTKKTIVAQENVPVRVIDEIKPIELLTTPAGETVIDMGQNMVGWVRFTVKGAAAGDKVVLRHGEVLDKDGNFYTGNLRTAKQTIEYICKGGEESFEPHFTFQGFRYVQIVEYPGTPKLDSFVGRVIHSDMEPTGTFECSDPLINQLQHNIVWGQKGNFVDVPTDCPQRDERLGWTGDAQVFIRTAAYNMHVAPFFTKWLRDLTADQKPNGGVPSVIPDVFKDHNHSSAWGDAAVICPWTIYLCYGDKRILAEQFESMKAWVEYIRAQGDNEFLWNTGFHYGDWLGLDAKEDSYTGATPKDYIATAFFAYSTDLVVKTAEVLGKSGDAERYRSLHGSIVRAFRDEFVTPSGRLASPTQTAHVLALMFNLVEGEVKKRVARTLAQLVIDNKHHLTTGFVGTPYLCLVLSENGYHDIAAKLVLERSYPSWLYSVTKGATTIWEHWDGIKQDGSFWSDDMNSFNHYAYGSVGSWLYSKVAGIDLDESEAGYKRLRLTPSPGHGFTYAKAAHRTMYGDVLSSWTLTEDGGVQVEVAIPANTTAVLELPSVRADGLREQGRPVGEAEGVALLSETEQGVMLNLASGTYSFAYSIG